MDLRQLRYVEAVARRASFTRAAEELHVAQPALSLTIRSLEAELGVRLFDRTSRRVRPTDAGEALAGEARRILREADQIVDRMAEYAGAVRGRVTVSIWYHLDPDLPRLLRDFVTGNPHVQVSIVELPAPKTIAALRAGELDFGLVAAFPGLELTGLETTVVWEAPLELAVVPGHPLASRRSVSLAELGDPPLIVTSPATAQRAWLDLALAQAGVRPRVVLETNELAAAVTYTSIGIGATMLFRRVIEAMRVEVAIVPMDEAPTVRMLLVWDPTRELGPAAARALAFARNAAPDRGAGRDS